MAPKSILKMLEANTINKELIVTIEDFIKKIILRPWQKINSSQPRQNA